MLFVPLAAYLERMNILRTSSRLLVSFTSPHKAISRQSVSRWFARALQLAGVHLSYSGHSARGASTSAAAAAGRSVDLILEAADWASTQEFERFITENNAVVPSIAYMVKLASFGCFVNDTCFLGIVKPLWLR